MRDGLRRQADEVRCECRPRWHNGSAGAGANSPQHRQCSRPEMGQVQLGPDVPVSPNETFYGNMGIAQKRISGEERHKPNDGASAPLKIM